MNITLEEITENRARPRQEIVERECLMKLRMSGKRCWSSGSRCSTTNIVAKKDASGVWLEFVAGVWGQSFFLAFAPASRRHSHFSPKAVAIFTFLVSPCISLAPAMLDRYLAA